MSKLILSLAIVFSLSSLAKNTVKEKPFYGKEIKAKTATALDQVLQNYEKFENKDVVMEAGVEKVCTKKGCWMTLQGSKKTFRVKFHDYSYFVPLSLIGSILCLSAASGKKFGSKGSSIKKKFQLPIPSTTLKMQELIRPSSMQSRPQHLNTLSLLREFKSSMNNKLYDL